MAETTKRPAKKTAAKKSPAKKAPAKRSASQPAKQQGPKPVQVAVQGAQQLSELTGKDFEGIVGIEKSDDGWTVRVEVLEMRRIPATTDVLALYEVEVDQSGDLVSYRRAERYTRGKGGEDGR